MSAPWERRFAVLIFLVVVALALAIGTCQDAGAVTSKPTLTAESASTSARAAEFCPVFETEMIPRPSATMSLSVRNPAGAHLPLWRTMCWYKEKRSWKKPSR